MWRENSTSCSPQVLSVVHGAKTTWLVWLKYLEIVKIFFIVCIILMPNACDCTALTQPETPEMANNTPRQNSGQYFMLSHF